MNKEIHVFIVENPELVKALIRDHFNKDGITYAAVFKAESRGAITSALDGIEDDEPTP